MREEGKKLDPKFAYWKGIPREEITWHPTIDESKCVGCGMCEDACPKGIELQRLFYGVGEKTAAVFDYHPGMNLEEEPPLTTFREEELQELG